MEWVLLVAVLALGLGLGWAARRSSSAGTPSSGRPRRGRPRASDDTDQLFLHDDDAELRARFAAAEQEAGRSKAALVHARLDELRDRQVPLRSVRPAPSEHSARLLFANGAAVIGRADRPGQVYRLAMALQHRHRITLRSWSDQGAEIALTLGWAGDGSAELIAEGLDQSD